MAALSKYKTYPEYKDSGVEWLGEIPSHWELWKLFHAYNEIGSGTTPPTSSNEWFENGVIPWVTTGELRENTIIQTNKRITKKTQATFSTLKIYPIGSVVIAMYGATIGRLGILGTPSTTNQACCVMTKSEYLDNKYVFYWLYAFKKDIINLSSGGGQPNINQEKVASLKISAPIKQEQTKIAQFLDHETAKIDQLIEKQQSLIELLKEKRQAVISHAVTKGLNPNAKMKDSGVEWLGEVPEHWNISRLGFESLIKARLGWKGLKAEEYVEQGYIFLATPNIKSTDIDFENVNYITKKRYEESPEIMLKKGDVLVTKDGSTTGTTNIVRNLPSPATVNSSIAVIRPNSSLHPEYLYYYCISPYTQNVIKRMQGGMGVPHLFQADLRIFNLILPPIHEQIEIATYLDSRTSKIDLLIQKAEEQIELMKERRTALISAAVTGKIDVRDWQPKQ